MVFVMDYTHSLDIIITSLDIQLTAETVQTKNQKNKCGGQRFSHFPSQPFIVEDFPSLVSVLFAR